VGVVVLVQECVFAKRCVVWEGAKEERTRC
jgi:hypothetical protein